MKLNKTLMMAALMASGLLATNVAVRAQDSTNTPPTKAHTPGGRMGGNFEMLATQLALTDEQKDKVKPLFEDMRQKMMDLRKDTTLEKADRMAKMKSIHEDFTAKLKEALTADQFAKWQKMATPHRPAPASAVQPPTGTPPPAGNPPAQP